MVDTNVVDDYYSNMKSSSPKKKKTWVKKTLKVKAKKVVKKAKKWVAADSGLPKKSVSKNTQWKSSLQPKMKVVRSVSNSSKKDWATFKKKQYVARARTAKSSWDWTSFQSSTRYVKKPRVVQNLRVAEKT
jgi:hypothetical protein